MSIVLAQLGGLVTFLTADTDYKLLGLLLGALAGIGAFWAHARRDAWLPVYNAKRALVEEFWLTLDRFAITIEMLYDVESVANEPVRTKTQYLLGFIRQRFGPNPDAVNDVMLHAIHANINKLLSIRPDATDAEIKSPVEQGRLLFKQILLSDLQALHAHLGTLNTRLALVLSDPDVPRRAIAHADREFDRVLNSPIDPNAKQPFFDAWNKNVNRVKLTLRREVYRSAFGLRAATRLSYRFQAKTLWRRHIRPRLEARRARTRS